MNTGSSSRSCSADLSNKVLTVFKRFDLKGDGSINRDELKKVMHALDPATWTDRRISRLLHALDKNRDGRLQYQEFVQWACSEDTSEDLKAFRQALQISQEEAKAAPRKLPSVVRRRSLSRARSKPFSARGAAPRASSASKQPVRRKTSGDVPENALPPVCPETDPESQQLRLGAARRPLDVARTAALPQAEDTPPEEPRRDVSPHGEPCQNAVLALPEVLQAAAKDMPAELLIIFDYDGTITMDKDEKFKGLMGHRLSRLKDMMTKIRESSARCVLVTAQFPAATRDITIPALEKTSLSGLFENELLDARLGLYWDDAEHGTIYNGAKAMMGKIDLIKKIIDGENCWQKAFDPSNVLFIDDDVRNFRGHEKIGIHIRHVAQDGMAEQDIEVVEAFAQGLREAVSKGDPAE